MWEEWMRENERRMRKEREHTCMRKWTMHLLYFILVTLETSQASSWLKACADCQAKARHCGKWEARWILRGGWLRASDAEAGGAAHGEHPVHAGYSRDFPSERLVESACRLPGEARRDGKWEASESGCRLTGKATGVGWEGKARYFVRRLGVRVRWRQGSVVHRGSAAHIEHQVHASHA